MRRGKAYLFIISFILVLSLSLVSAGLLENLWGKISGYAPAGANAINPTNDGGCISNVQCPAGTSCVNGICKAVSTTPYCSKVGGINYFVKGSISWGLVERGNFYESTSYDGCIDSNYLREFYCDSTTVKWEEYKCPNGCEVTTGICKSATDLPKTCTQMGGEICSDSLCSTSLVTSSEGNVCCLGVCSIASTCTIASCEKNNAFSSSSLPYCNSDKTAVLQSYDYYSCSGGKCILSNNQPKEKQNCASLNQVCDNGVCKTLTDGTSCTPSNIITICGVNGSIDGTKKCSGNGVFQNFENFTCVNSKCVRTISGQIVERCKETCENGICKTNNLNTITRCERASDINYYQLVPGFSRVNYVNGTIKDLLDICDGNATKQFDCRNSKNDYTLLECAIGQICEGGVCKVQVTVADCIRLQDENYYQLNFGISKLTYSNGTIKEFADVCEGNATKQFNCVNQNYSILNCTSSQVCDQGICKLKTEVCANGCSYDGKCFSYGEERQEWLSYSVCTVKGWMQEGSLREGQDCSIYVGNTNMWSTIGAKLCGGSGNDHSYSCCYDNNYTKYGLCSGKNRDCGVKVNNNENTGNIGSYLGEFDGGSRKAEVDKCVGPQWSDINVIEARSSKLVDKLGDSIGQRKDSCASTSQTVKYYCGVSGKDIKLELRECAKGYSCKQDSNEVGKCVKDDFSSTGTTTCTDSDGIDKFRFGTAKTEVETKVDVCKDITTVNESYCQEGKIKIKDMDCGYFKLCENGVCTDMIRGMDKSACLSATNSIKCWSEEYATCYDIGRIDKLDSYCDTDKNIKPYQENGASCNKDSMCKSNKCCHDKCKSSWNSFWSGCN